MNRHKIGRIAVGVVAAVLLCGCTAKNRDYVEVEPDIAERFPIEAEPVLENPQLAESDGPYALLHTTAGDIKMLLYPKQAPKAVENFITLAKEGYYDNTKIFYVKKDQIFQAGRPAAGTDGTVEEKSSFGEAFEDEFDDGIHNFAGAVGMAGNGMNQNLSQFYVVTGDRKPENEKEISANFYMNELIRESAAELNQRNSEAEMSEEEVQAFEAELNAKIQAIATDGVPEAYMERYQPAVEQYLKTGGAWSLDYKQTVFGQIVEGLNVAEAVTQVKVDPADRSPKKEIWIQSIEILE